MVIGHSACTNQVVSCGCILHQSHAGVLLFMDRAAGYRYNDLLHVFDLCGAV